MLLFVSLMAQCCDVLRMTFFSWLPNSHSNSSLLQILSLARTLDYFYKATVGCRVYGKSLARDLMIISLPRFATDIHISAGEPPTVRCA